MERLKDKVAVVTGAAQGIGRTYALALADNGAKVVATDVQDCSETVDLIKQAGGQALGVQTDVWPDIVRR